MNTTLPTIPTADSFLTPNAQAPEQTPAQAEPEQPNPFDWRNILLLAGAAFLAWGAWILFAVYRAERGE